MASIFSPTRARGLVVGSCPLVLRTRLTSRSLHTNTPTLPSLSKETSEILSRAANYLLPVYDRPPIVLSRGKGSYVWDTEGRRYLDFTAGIAVNALGHADDGVVKTMTEQAAKLLHTSNVFNNEWAGKLAEQLITNTQKEGGLGYVARGEISTANSPGGKVFFANSGTEANEGALKIARKIGKDLWAAASSGQISACNKTKIVCFENSFHGRSMGALSVTSTKKYQQPFEPLIPGVQVCKLNDVEGAEKAVTEDTCAVIVEPIQGEGGVHVATENWLRFLRKKCDDVGAVLIFDEIQCGLYRTGTLWAHSRLPVDCHPDIITVAKPLANGYPIGAVLLRNNVAETMTAGTHGTTFGGSPLACALGHHVFSRLSDRAFVSHIQEISVYLMNRLQHLPARFPDKLQPAIRGRGLILGLGFKDEGGPKRVVAMARERGVLFLTAGSDALRLVPSLNIGREEVDAAVNVIEEIFTEMS